MNRREVVAWLMAGWVQPPFRQLDKSEVRLDSDPLLVARQQVIQAGTPAVQTRAGFVRGVRENKVYVFKGIPYAAPPMGPNRFRGPVAMVPWSGVREATSFGTPQLQLSRYDAEYARVLRGLYAEDFFDPRRPVVGSEDCLYLNIWTPTLGSDDRLPVMIWLHPGAFVSWSGYSPWTDGARLADREKVVVVSLNHRLGVFGHLYLDEQGGPSFAGSGNAGMLDIVAALSWVQENISAFGGDADNVTVFGESGGAGKVSILMGMPAAEGLFHKAIVMGGSVNIVATGGVAARATSQLLERLNVLATDLRPLQTLAGSTILEASRGLSFRPVKDSTTLPNHPFYPRAAGAMAAVPMMIGTARNEFRYPPAEVSPEVPDHEAACNVLLSTMRGYGLNKKSSERAIDALRSLRPVSSWREVMVESATAIYRDDAIYQAEAKLRQNAGPVYMYLWKWASPAFGGRYGAMHTFDVPFAFDNLAAAPQILAGVPPFRAQRLATHMRSAIGAFARTGNPNRTGRPVWRPYDVKQRSTMVIDYRWELERDPMKDVRQAIAALRAERLSQKLGDSR